MKYRIVKNDLGSYCRNCLNEKHGIGLNPSDCYYFTYPRMCTGCGEMKNIVDHIRFKKRLSIRFR